MPQEKLGPSRLPAELPAPHTVLEPLGLNPSGKLDHLLGLVDLPVIRQQVGPGAQQADRFRRQGSFRIAGKVLGRRGVNGAANLTFGSPEVSRLGEQPRPDEGEIGTRGA